MAALQNARESVAGNAERAAADLLKLAAETRGAGARARARRWPLRDARARRAGEARGAARARCAGERDERPRARAEARARGRRRSAREADALQSERDGLAGRLSSLEEMVATHAAFDEGVRALLARPGRASRSWASWPTPSRPTPRYERAVEAFLGDRLQAVLVPDAAHALRGIRYLEESGAGPRHVPAPGLRAHARPSARRCATSRAQEPKARGPARRPLPRDRPPRGRASAPSLPDALVVETLEDALEVVAPPAARSPA